MNKNALLILAIIPFFALAAWNSPLNDDWKKKVDSAVFQQLERSSETDFLILFQEQATIPQAKAIRDKAAKGAYVYEQLKAVTKNSQANAVQILKTKNIKYSSFFIVNSIHTKGNEALLRALAMLPEVKQIVNNSPIKLEEPIVPDDVAERGPSAIEWGIENINADDVWAMGYTGQGVVIAGQDTGYEWDHPALKETYRGWDGTDADHNYNWHDAIHEIDLNHNDSIIEASNNSCGLDSPFPCDDSNHGTHTMGTMIGEDGENQIGVAPGARWMACRNMERGWGTPTTYMECYEWFIAPTDLNNENPNPALAPHVINNSWGCPPTEGCDTSNFHIMNTVINNVKAAGIVVVASAGNGGNGGCSTVSNPSAIYENSFSIGAIQMSDAIASFSSRGPVTVDGSNRLKPNVSAPGSNVRSTIRGGAYASFSGTSMAGPHVAGLVALLISAKPELAGQVEEIETIIEQTARPKFSAEGCGGLDSLTSPNHVYGYGNVDALAAIQMVLGTSSTEDWDVMPLAKIYPNPFQEALTIERTDVTQTTILKLYTTNGQLLLEQQLNQNINVQTIAMPALAKGIYFYTIGNKTEMQQGKLVKQ